LACFDCAKLVLKKLSSFSMHQITIRLPCNRDYAGTLKLEDAKGKLIAGPFKICARAHDELARANGNPDRLPVLPFGDMPLGEYQITQIVPSGPGTPYDGDEFGSAGIIFLQPRHGEAVLADANGRFIFLIHGGALSRNGALRPTQDGSLRLSNRDQRKLTSVLRRVGAGACRCIVTNSGNAKHRVATAGSARPKRASARGAAAAGLAETSRRSWLRTMLIAAGAFASVPSLLLFSPPKAYGDGGGTDYSPKGDLDKYQDQLKQAQDEAAQAQADYEKEKTTNPNANMAPLLDAEGKVQGLQDMVRYEQQQAAQQTPPATTTTTESTNENPTNTGPTTTEPNNQNPATTTTTTEPTNETPANTAPPPVTEPTYENPTNTTPPTTTTEPNNENPATTTTTTGTETTNENPTNTATTTTEPNNENPATTTPPTGTETTSENPATTTTATGTETTNENPANSQTMTVSEPTYNHGSDTQAQPNSTQPGTETDMRDAPHDTQPNPNQAQQGQITPFNNPPQPTIDQTPAQMPKGGNDKLATDQAHAIELNPDVNTKQTQFGWDTAGNKNANSFAVPVSTPQASPVGTELPFVIPDSMKKSPDVLELTKAQQQLNASQVAAAQAEANYKAAAKTDPNADMGPMIDAQAKFKGQQNFVNMLTEKVKVRLQRLPTGIAPTGQAGSAGSSSPQK
jgi:hypothetical protein